MQALADRIPILYLAPWVDLGGADKGTIDWFRHLDRTRWAPSLITTQPSANRWLHEVERYAEEVWALPDLMPGAGFPSMILGFIESRQIRLVHIMNSRIGFDLMPDMTCLRQPPAIVVQHHAEEPDRSGYVRYAAARYGNLVDAFSVTSRQLAMAMRDYDIAGSRIHVIHSGVDAEEEFDPATVAPMRHLPGRAPRVLWPGRLAEQKDPMLTLEVLRLLRDRSVEFTLHVVGDGPLEPAVRARAQELEVSEMIAWHSPSQQMAHWFRSCDLLLMTSLFEGVPYVIYEALAMEVPVVAPALPGNREFMDSDAGVLVDPRDDPNGYADAVEWLLAEPDRRQEMGARSRQRMLRDFSLRDMCARHESIYEQLLAKRTAAARGRREVIEEPTPASAPPLPELRLQRDPPPEPTVAVIVPCYQHGRYLPDCVASIQAQSLAAAEIIVVDDSSEDEETTVALRALEREPGVTVIRQPVNRGPSAGRNRALREVTANYVLPLDADDLLLPSALSELVNQLESARPDIGFVYPNPQHFGNRHDYVRSPTYNLHLLLKDNYCPATSLFDRRVFDAGAAYDEEIVFGHEDWDLVLQLAERGVWGENANGATFLYRRRGFSRVNAVEYGPRSFHEEIERRHPSLYGPQARMRIKARWAPALSILLLDESRAPADEPALANQSCQDFELVRGHESLAGMLAAARGRWVLAATSAAMTAFSRRSFVEQLLRAFAKPDVPGIVLTAVPQQRLAAFSQVEAPGSAEPLAVAWERWADAPDPLMAQLGSPPTPVADLIMALQLRGRLQWRSLPVPTAAAVTPTLFHTAEAAR